MDLSELLDTTEPVECEFMDHKIVAHVYTSGAKRLTREERELLASMNDNRPSPPSDDSPENEKKMQERAVYNASIDGLRSALPIIIKAVDLDGTPLLHKGVGFPENTSSFPDALLIAIGNPALDRWNAANPTIGTQVPDGSQLATNQNPSEQSQELSTTA